jgi:hypothetical protein
MPKTATELEEQQSRDNARQLSRLINRLQTTSDTVTKLQEYQFNASGDGSSARQDTYMKNQRVMVLQDLVAFATMLIFYQKLYQNW